MTRKVLLLNSTYEVLSFISYRKAIRLIVKNKADIVSIWENEKITYGNGHILFPSVLKMRYVVFRNFRKIIFSRNAVFIRDRLICCYCAKRLNYSQATLEHILPRSLGGISSFENCATACFPCNKRKANKTVEEAGFTLLIKPYIPMNYMFNLTGSGEEWNENWDQFLA